MSLSLLVNALNYTTTLTSHVTVGASTLTYTHFGQNVQESDSLTTIGNFTTETVGIPYNDAHTLLLFYQLRLSLLKVRTTRSGPH